MSLISLLIALAAERYLSSSAWQFSVYYQRYLRLFKKLDILGSPSKSTITNLIFLLVPVIVCYAVLAIVEDGLLHLIVSTLVLIACFGCFKTRDTYKQYLMAAFRGEATTCSLYHKQLMQDKNLPDMGFGQTLVWLNYRYFIAIMLFFVLFGAPGALFYRLLTKLNESPLCQLEHEEYLLKANLDDAQKAEQYQECKPCDDSNNEVLRLNQRLLFIIDWVPVRIVAFGYMLVGHFSRAFPVWLENLFATEKQAHYVLIDVAQKSEDFMVDQDDCTAEPCLLVRLAKRTLLLCLATVSMLIITGVVN
ncbi:beta-lactamase regulator AmpE [Thalassotalea marina]|uniref:Beta-lactamase regulator AmpE n=1 Tax=Thalassotalea marina TaxID=1673741 RepID=A0A919EHC8_9GAMM|nr:beta-lactamase regulator AmpE [Thalassotalea marina]GHF79645.1 beta-lactamase regulator AmpE [Thalassotalea marina]